MEKPSRFWVPACTYWQSLEMFYRRHKSLAQYCKPFFTILQHYIHVSRSCSFSSEEECESKCKDAKKDPNKDKEEAVTQGKFSKVIFVCAAKRGKACMMSLEKSHNRLLFFLATTTHSRRIPQGYCLLSARRLPKSIIFYVDSTCYIFLLSINIVGLTLFPKKGSSLWTL